MKNLLKIFFMVNLIMIVNGMSMSQIEASNEVLPFSLGEIEIQHHQETITIELTGLLSVPLIEGEFPIVLIIPEVASSQEISGRYHQLLKSLSQIPALGVLIDLSSLKDVETIDETLIATVFNHYRVSLNQAIQDESLAFEKNLYDKGSFSEVILIGSGESVDSIYQIIANHHNKQLSVSGVILIDPQRKREVPNLTLLDTPTAIILPYALLEQNAIGLSFFQRNRVEVNRQSMTTMVYVQPDTSLFNMSEFEYLNFLSQYAIAFIQSIFKEAPEGIGLSPLEVAPKMIFDTAVKTSLIVPETLPILQPKKEKDPHFNVLGGTNRFINLTLDHYKGLVDMYKLKWETENSLLEIELPKEYRDLTYYDALSLYINYYHPEQEPLSFILELQDMEGQFQQVEVKNWEPLNNNSGTVIPFYHERFILKDLMEVDLTSVRFIKFIFEIENLGELNIGDVSLIKSLN